MRELLLACGVYTIECRRPDGRLRWRGVAPNLITTVGKNLILNAALDGALFPNYTATEYIGVIPSASYGAGPVASDTMTSHPGWIEASTAFLGSGAVRPTAAWNAASAATKALSSWLALGTSMASPITVKGIFIVGGSGALATIGNTAGTLISAGTLGGGDQVALAGDQLWASYSLSI